MNIKMLKAAVAGLVLSVSGFTNVAFAGLIVDNGFDVNATTSISWTNQIGSWRTYEDFALASNTQLTSASFLFNNGNGSTNYLFDIHADNAGTYGSLLHSIALTSSDVTVNSVIGGWWQFDFSLPSINLVAGNYWVSFSGTSTWGSKLGTFGEELVQTDSFGNRNVRTGDYVPFRLNGTTSEVPEPSTIAIFALGMIGLASRRFKKQS